MPSNPFESPLHKSDLPKTVTRSSCLLKCFFMVLAVVLIVAMLLPFGRTARPAARRAGCINYLRQIGLAISNYEMANGSLPPVYTVDENGNRLHSWRTLILPYIEEQQLYDSIDLSKPWDDPANAKAREAVVSVYACPGTFAEPPLTTYLALLGPNCGLSVATDKTVDDFEQAGKFTPVVVDMPSDQAVHWMSPQDTDLAALAQLASHDELNHDTVVAVHFLDGHVMTIGVGSIAEVARRIETGEMPDFDDL